MQVDVKALLFNPATHAKASFFTSRIAAWSCGHAEGKILVVVFIVLGRLGPQTCLKPVNLVPLVIKPHDLFCYLGYLILGVVRNILINLIV